jgi:uncharacterized repeat protein (TIGR01451 family)
VHVTAPATPSLTAGMTAAPSHVLPGTDVTYSLSIRNVGSATASSLTIQHILPTGSILRGYSPASVCSVLSEKVTCTWPSLQAGSSITFAFTAKAPMQPGAYTNRVTVTSPDVVQPASASAAIQVVTALLPATVTLSMNASPARVTVGGRLTVTMSSSNTETAPPGMSASHWPCRPDRW